ncbi:hypothetical protein NL676_016228 [Syzygium grande]|nr:hypothetical protein NL676_016228 [Syzygium grande]
MRTTPGGGGCPHVAVLAFPFGTNAAPLFAAVRRPRHALHFLQHRRFHRLHLLGLPRLAQRESVRRGRWSAGGLRAGGEASVGHRAVPEGGPSQLQERDEGGGGRDGEEGELLGLRRLVLFTKIMEWSHLGVAGIEGREDETLHFIPGISKVTIRDMPEGVVFGDLDSLLPHALRHGKSFAENSFEESDPTITDDLKSKLLNNFLNVDPFNLIATPPRASDESRPFFGDQRFNGRMMEEVWGLGVGVEGGVFTKKAVMSCLQLSIPRKSMRD